jgi:hypothetical protein
MKNVLLLILFHLFLVILAKILVAIIVEDAVKIS